ncbi:sigma-70 family RNA polymerase sigma factor [Microlunatus flavus]|uniref:RNA polymerase sigma-B factor n=1 Tax=Microlunatus flavus TaxID=1036181 RepID=A0A1H8ZV58_9ACTN|nr:sigma-70 family RNA polymerase sigma factor [Microlunatus flavus]SEP67638.1 RNA polymerase sigma-B factor [Microlunatus flavus]
MRAEGEGVELPLDSLLEVAPRGTKRVDELIGHDLGQRPARDLNTPPRGREREAERERTADLIGLLGGATPDERRMIRDEVVTLHLWLATSAARRYGPRSEYDDLVQVARGGLVEAFDRYDPSQTTYAYFAWVTMTGLLRRYLRDHGWSVRPPRSVQEAANVLRGAVPDLSQEIGRPPTTADLAAHLGWTTQAVEDAKTAELGLHATSIDALVGDAWMPEHPPEWNVVETRVLLHHALRSLTDAERDLLRMRFLEEMTQSQIAAVVGVTQMQVSRLLSRLMTKMRGLIGELDGDGDVDELDPAGA